MVGCNGPAPTGPRPPPPGSPPSPVGQSDIKTALEILTVCASRAVAGDLTLTREEAAALLAERDELVRIARNILRWDMTHLEFDQARLDLRRLGIEPADVPEQTGEPS